MKTNQEKSSYKWFVLTILTLVYMFNFIDRQIIVILQEPIKEDLGLSDTQLGLLTGLAFAALYVILGIPIARFADKNNRKNIVALSLGIWSLMTILSGRALNFTQLMLARIGVGIGEAGGTPPAHSIISDYFPPNKRATALSIYSSGIFIGILMGFVIGGVLAKSYGWRTTLFLVGLPGVLFSIALYFLIKEPIRGRYDTKKKDYVPLSLVNSNNKLRKKKTFRYISVACGFIAFVSYGVGNFMPSYLSRVHGVDLTIISIVLGVTTGLGGGMGAFTGGYFADRLGQKDPRWFIWVSVVAGLLHIVPSIILALTTSATVAMAMTGITGFLVAVYLGPTIAVVHNLVGAEMRALSSSILYFVLNLIGLGFGPLTIGLISDYFQPEYGVDSLRWAFLFSLLPALISVFCFYKASQFYEEELEVQL